MALFLAWVWQIAFSQLAGAQLVDFMTPKNATVAAVANLPSGASFRFKNLDSKPLIIESVQPSHPLCNAKFTREPIQPGKIGSITLYCKFVENDGYFNKSALVQILSSRTGQQTIEKISISGETSAQDYCSALSFDSIGSPLEPLISTSRGIWQSAGSCAYQTAAQMFDAWRIRNEQLHHQKYTSPILTMIEMKRGRQINDLNGGFIADTLRQLRWHGGCPKRRPNSPWGVDPEEAFLHDLEDTYQSIQKMADETWVNAKLLELIQYVDSRMKQERLFKPKLDASVDQLKAAMKQHDLIKFIETLVDLTCNENERTKSHRSFKIEESKFDNDETNKVIRRVHRLLDRGIYEGLPIGVEYCAGVLDGGSDYREFNAVRAACNLRHASLVIGRRRNPKNGVCQFLVRNTWRGHSYHSDWEVDSEKDHLWINENSLGESIYTVISIRP